jgi:Fe2+ transport system protein FeoA
MRLSEVSPNSEVKIQSFHDSDLELKLLEFGIAINSSIAVQRKAPFGGPILIGTQNGSIALRKTEAQTLDVILIE